MLFESKVTNVNDCSKFWDTHLAFVCPKTWSCNHHHMRLNNTAYLGWNQCHGQVDHGHFQSKNFAFQISNFK